MAKARKKTGGAKSKTVMGRPPANGRETLTARLPQSRCTPSERRRLENLAKANSTTPTDAVRQAVNAATEAAGFGE